MTKRLIYTVCIGQPRPLWQRCIASMRTYCERHGIEHRLQTEMALRVMPKHSHRSPQAVALGGLPNLEKLHGLSLLGDYSQIALVDADVWATPDAPDIFDAVNPAVDFAGCVEREMECTPAYARKLDGYAHGQYGDARFPFFNCGVEVFNASMARHLHSQTIPEFIERPEFADLIDGKGAWKWASEQTLMNVWLRSCGATLQHLRPRWNVLFGAVTMPADAAFVHFFLSSHLTSEDPEEMIRTGRGRPRV